jgi:hypothetical protein
MRTSGTGRDGWMTIVPVAILIVFITVMNGGPRETLVLAERYLEALVSWVADLRL